MMIGSKKIRKKVNNAIDNFGIGVFLIAWPFAIVAGIVAGAWNRLTGNVHDDNEELSFCEK